MRHFLLIASLFFCSFFATAQSLFKTVIPKKAVVAGESFLIQYVLQDESKNVSIKPPVFEGFRFINGPNIYKGKVDDLNGPVTVQNYVYALEAIRPGKYLIPGAIALVNGKSLKSDDAVIEVVAASPLPDPASDYFLHPGEDPYVKIKQNLFLKVMVDRTSCFVGQPIVATFKLYSRLESKSDIIKNPGFYGFSVYDMINLSDHEVSVEKLNGKSFDVHTIRKVQLYPFREGEFTIDPMEVKNKVEFSRSAVNKKTEQEIVEGMFGNDRGESSPVNTDTYETSISTIPLTIKVRATPLNNKPDTFSGAVGNFKIEAHLKNARVLKEEEGKLIVKISGAGNFKEIATPEISWPEGIEGFDIFHRNYLIHNEKLWDRYRKGFIKVDELRWKRMWLALLDFKIADETLARDMGNRFLDLLPSRKILFPYTIEILDYLTKKNYKLHLITNGFEKTQHSKLKNSGLDKYFVEVITSEGSNSLKPNKAIFDYALDKTGSTLAESIMIGDSIEVDIIGAMNAGMDQIFVNHLNLETEVKPTYTVESLKELENIF